MATLGTTWFLSILLVILPNFCVAGGPPDPPVNLLCFILCDGRRCRKDICCTWDPPSGNPTTTNYSLHWEPSSEEDHVTNGTSLNGIIYRRQFSSHSNLRAWVQAKNQYGSVNSKKIEFNTGNINRPIPPSNFRTYPEELMISWTPNCVEQENEPICEVQHRIEAEQVWNKTVEVTSPFFTLEHPQPCNIAFRVRCKCKSSLMSEWSEICQMRQEAAPIGELDLWMDCGMSPTSADCFLTWKELPPSQTCGKILGYEVKLLAHNGTVSSNVFESYQEGQLVCNDTKCYLNHSLTDVSSARVSAYNAYGATKPSHLTISTQDEHENAQYIHLDMNEESLNVSWNQLSGKASFMEYVVQYKQAGSPPCQEFDWARVKKNHTKTFFKGLFKKYTPYQVSLFTVSEDKRYHHHSSLTGYSLQGTPPKVALFKVKSISATEVTLFWEPGPLSKQKGVILFYQIGIVRTNEVYSVSAHQQQKSIYHKLQNLNPGQEYNVWIRAVTQAGPGDNHTIAFQTDPKDYDIATPVIAITVTTVCLLAFTYCCAYNRGESKGCLLVYEKVPDPHNSRIFKQMKHQINDPLAWTCISIYEPYPKISQLEIVEIQPSPLEPSMETTSHHDGLTRPVVDDESSEIDFQDNQRKDAVTEECDRIEGRYKRKEYSKMIDSDEEDKADSWSSSEEEEFTSGYEKHFMPTPLEMLEVS